MENLTTTEKRELSVLDSYAQQGRFFLSSAAQSLIQFGRVLCEAKPLVPHGQFGKWYEESFGLSKSTAANYMAVWKRFGNSEQFSRISFSNLREMLALPEGTEAEFAQEHPVDEMTARAVKEAVQKAVAEEREKREEAEKRLEELRNAPEPADDGMRDALLRERERAEIAEGRANELREQAAELLTVKNQLAGEVTTLRRDLRDAEADLEESQQQYDQLRSELLNAQSSAAKGDAERVFSERMTGDSFADDVRGFLGRMCSVPVMGAAFAVMDAQERRLFSEHLDAMERWVKDSRKAMNTEVVYAE